VDDRHDSIVVEGDDAEHVLPPAELDPYTPEPAPPNRKARAVLTVALAILVVLVAIAIYGLAR
jgi:hypothetical protein